MAYLKRKKWGRVKPPVGCVVDWSDPISRGLVGYWPMNSGAGIYENDIARNNNGTLAAGVVRGVGDLGKTLKFTGGSTSHFDVANTLLSGATQFTISFWGMHSATATNTFIHGGSTTYSGSYYFGPDGSNLLQYYLSSFKIAGTTTLTLGKWYHYVITYSGNPKEATIWINGVRETLSNSASIPTSILTHTGIEVGYTTPNASFGLTGAVDNLRVYLRVLNQNEIIRLTREPFAGVQSNVLRIRSQVSSGAAPYKSNFAAFF